MPFLPILGGTVTAIWIGAVYHWVSWQIGWRDLGSLAFDEQAVAGLAFFLPPLFLWLAIAIAHQGRQGRSRLDKLIVLLDAFVEPTAKNNRYANESIAAMQKQADLLTQGSSAAIERAELFAKIFAQKLEDITVLSKNLDKQLHIVEADMGRHTNRMQQISDQIATHTQDSRQDLQQSLKDFDAAVETVCEKTQNTRHAFEAYATSIDALAETTVTREKSMLEDIASQNESLRLATDAAADQARYVRDTFALYARDLETSSQSAADQAEALGKSVRRQIRDIEMAGEALEAKTGTSGEKVAHTLTAMREDGEAFSRLFDDVITRAKTATKNLGDSYEKASREAEQTIEQCLTANQQLGTSCDDVSHRLTKVCDDVRNQADHIAKSSAQIVESVTAVATKSVAEAAKNFSLHVKEIEHNIGKSQQDIATLTQAATEAMTQLVDRGLDVTQRVAQESKTLAGQITDLQSTGLSVADHLDKAHTGVTQKITSLNALSDKANSDLTDTGKTLTGVGKQVGATWRESSRQIKEFMTRLHEQRKDFENTTRSVRDHTIEMRQSLQKQIVEWGEIVRSFETRARKAEEGFRAQMDELLGTTRDIEARTHAAIKSNIITQRSGFLEASSFIIEKMQSLSVDIARLLDPTSSRTEWDRYLRGDRGFFVRLLGQGKYADMAAKIRQHIKDDEQFRRYVLEYISEFKTLTEQAQAVDHSRILEQTLLSSDVGKVYMLLTKVLGAKS